MSIKNNHSDSCELVHCELLKRIRVFQLDDEQNVTESRSTTNILPGINGQSLYLLHVKIKMLPGNEGISWGYQQGSQYLNSLTLFMGEFPYLYVPMKLID